MKKNLITIVGCYFFFLFLVYLGIFRNYSDPVRVARYYYECVKNREWFLTYQIYLSDNFNASRIIDESFENSLFLIDKIQISSVDIKDNHAYIQAKLIYKDKSKKNICSIMELEKIGKKWFVKEVNYFLNNYANHKIK